MTWCKDIPRDAAVRAAEDGRTGPLPTLGEAIASPFAEAAERSVPVSKTGEGQSGMRKERVTLEVVHGAIASVNDQRWWDNRLWIEPQKGESVRVVEEDREAVDRVSREEGYQVLQAEMLTAREERDTAIREREELREQLESVACRAATAETALGEIKSLHYTRAAVNGAAWKAHSIASKALEAASGGEGEPVAWMCEWTDYGSLHRFKSDAEDAANGTVVPQPLYRAPPQPRGWLTEEERDLIAGITDDDEFTEEGQNIAKGLLARSTPPEVVKPGPWKIAPEFLALGLKWRQFIDDYNQQRDSEWIAAIAVAGVAVKEVGRD